MIWRQLHQFISDGVHRQFGVVAQVEDSQLVTVLQLHIKESAKKIAYVHCSILLFVVLMERLMETNVKQIVQTLRWLIKESAKNHVFAQLSSLNVHFVEQMVTLIQVNVKPSVQEQQLLIPELV